jgi:ABC-type Fe2+-enterobactin transport system substrate-binding protein
MKNVVAIIIVAMATSLNAETLSFPSFGIEIPNGWEHSIENGPGYDQRSVISLRHPNGVGSLKMLSYDAPVVVSKDRLRNMTNVDSSTSLTWKNWGDYSGYQYDYLERGTFYRQWWLVSERTLVLITYQCDPESKDIEAEEIDKIVGSITVGNS